MKQKNIMIYGGEFFNKGAQAMSFLTISRLKAAYPEHNILFISEMDSRRPEKELNVYNFDIITSPFEGNNFLGENLLRKLVGKAKKDNPKYVKKLLNDTEILFDISGYELSSQWGLRTTEKYLNRLNTAHQYQIKTVLLPQSIGPFNYTENTKEIITDLQTTLKDVEIIMPRESQGEEALNQIGVIENVKQLPDLVLTSKESVNWDLIYKNVSDEKQYTIQPNSVGIIPNMRNFDHANKERILDLYEETINYLRTEGKNVYLTRHSNEDIEACRLIKSMFVDDSSVQIIEDDMTPAEFEKMVEQFDFTIASRYHSVIHSFKVKTPCLTLGWAIKYLEIAKLFNQEDYIFDVRENFDNESFVNKVKKMNSEYMTESREIEKRLSATDQFEDPFDFAFRILNQD